jgi:CRP-like cAMP-binding protein
VIRKLDQFMADKSIDSCRSCPIGKTTDIISGGTCPWVGRQRQAGELLYLQGEPARTVWFVKRGTVVLTRAGVDGHEGPQAVRGAGTFVGLEALVRPTYQHQARLTVPSVVCAASVDTVDEWLGPPDSPARAALVQVLETVASDLPRAAGPDGPAVRRVASWLCDQAKEGMAPPIPRQVVAGLLGMTPATFSRALAALAARGTITLTRRTLRVRDPEALLAAAGSP